MYTILLVIHSILVIFLIMMVLIQRTDSDGLSGMSGGGNQFMTGRAQANLLTRVTAVLAALFMITSLALAMMAGRMSSRSIIDAVPVTETAPVAKPEVNKDKQEKKQSPAVPKPE